MDLAQLTHDGRHVDTLRDRIIFPVTDAEQRIRGFIGRDITGGTRAPKYRNPTRTPTFDKSQVLHRPTNHILNPSGTVVVVEGVLDAVAIATAAAAAGRTADFAPCTASGVAVTNAQATQVRALAREAHCVIALDGDQAGAEGTSRWLLELSVLHRELARVTHLPDGLDPADWIRRHGVAGLDAFDASPGPRPVGGITPALPGRELAQLAINGRGGPVANACQHLIRLIDQLPPAEARELLEQPEREMTRHGWNARGDFSTAVRPYPEAQAAAPPTRSLTAPLRRPRHDHGIGLP